MKICYLGDLAPLGEIAQSGVPKVSETLLREFQDQPAITVLAVSMVDGLAKATQRTVGNVTYHYHPCSARGKTATFYQREIRQLRRIISDFSPDVTHGQPPPPYLLAATLADAPSIITIHGLVKRETKGMRILSTAFCSNLIREFLQRKAIRHTRGIISISPYVNEYLSTLKSFANIIEIPNPIEKDFFKIAPPSTLDANILCVGTLSPRKNQLLLIEACRKLRANGIKFQCRFVGNHHDATLKKARELVREHNLSDSVVFCGVVSNTELYALYSWASLVVLPSLEETSPLSLIQAFAAGRLVLGANAAGIPDLFRALKSGILFENNVDDLSDKLERAVTAKCWLNIDIQAKDSAKAHFHPTSVAKATISAYKQLINQSARRHSMAQLDEA